MLSSCDWLISIAPCWISDPILHLQLEHQFHSVYGPERTLFLHKVSLFFSVFQDPLTILTTGKFDIVVYTVVCRVYIRAEHGKENKETHGKLKETSPSMMND
jgi:hypothetical protein